MTEDHGQPWFAADGIIRDRDDRIVALCSGSQPIADTYAQAIVAAMNSQLDSSGMTIRAAIDAAMAADENGEDG